MPDFTAVVKQGTYYFPATSRYSNMVNPIVRCDRCQKTNLKACINHGQYDLCLLCADDLTEHVSPPRIDSSDKTDPNYMTLMRQTIFNPPISHAVRMMRPIFEKDNIEGFERELTRMERAVFRHDRPVTKMRQGKFKKKCDEEDLDDMTFMEQRMFRDMPTTNMRQSMFEMPSTNMEQSMFKSFPRTNMKQNMLNPHEMD
jgi:hypothetical protein